MATLRKIWCANAGQAWAEVIRLFEAWCVGTWDTIDAVPSTDGGLNTVLVTVSNETGEFEFEYIVSSIEVGRLASLYEVMTSPGWRAQPTGTVQVADKDVGIAFDGVIVPAKKMIIEQFCGATVAGENQQSALTEIYFNAYWNHWMWRVIRNQEIAIDEAFLWESNISGGVEVDDDIGEPSDGLIAGPGGSFASPGVNLQPVVTALEDIATRSVDYIANNGSAIFSMYGKVNTET